MRMQSSPLTWYGGKNRLVGWLRKFVPDDLSTVVDVFGGSGVFCANISAPVRVYNDINNEVVFLYRVMRERKCELIEVLRLTPYARSEYGICLDNDIDDELERARRLFVKFRMAWGGGGRKVKASDWIYSISDCARGMSSSVSRFRGGVELIDGFVDVMNMVQFECLPFDDLIPRYDTPATLFYCDPPYPLSTRSQNTGVRYVHELDEGDHVRLANLLNKVSGLAMVSGYHSKLYEGLYEGWGKYEYETVANATKGENGRRVECLWVSPRLMDILRGRLVKQYRLL